MLPNPDSAGEPLLEVIDNLAPAALHAAAWATCAGKGWYFGHGSNPGQQTPFWKMDLNGDSAFDAIWEHVRPRCEALAGARLRVIRQYANGHTYGLGGAPHLDDTRPGAFTLLYYPHPEWKEDWDGETVYYDQDGEIALAVRPRPNRAVLFDSRILHNGRAPSRACPALRVTVAYKLLAVGSDGAERPSVAVTVPAAPASEPPPLGVAEISRDGARRVYSITVPESQIAAEVERRLDELAQSVRLPGFRPGQTSRRVIEERYGEQARQEVLKRAVDQAISSLLPGAIPAGCELVAGARSGDAEFRLTSTHLADLPRLDASSWTLERLTASADVLAAAQMTAEAAAALFRERLHRDVLDRLDDAFRFPVLPSLVALEYAALWKSAQAQAAPVGDADRKELEERLRSIAERRLRLGFVLTELGRRLGITAASGPELEEQVIGRIVADAHVEERSLTAAELV